MTTTLRPTEPEQYDEGVRSRTFDLCANSRPVGLVRLSTDPLNGPSTGRIVQLLVDERERRRGRGTAGALAAEEILRDWGCIRAEVSVLQRSAGALAFAPALGYVESGRHMLKVLDDAEDLPGPAEGSTVRPMTAGEFASWRERDRSAHFASLLERGLPRRAAEKRVGNDERLFFPDGGQSSGTVLRVLEHHGAPVGLLWLDLNRAPRDDADAWLHVLEVREDARGRGHGRALMHVAEAAARAAGRSVLGLRARPADAPALRFHTASGFRPVERLYWKSLV